MEFLLAKNGNDPRARTADLHNRYEITRIPAAPRPRGVPLTGNMHRIDTDDAQR
jgi:hypothetical protein